MAKTSKPEDRAPRTKSLVLAALVGVFLLVPLLVMLLSPSYDELVRRGLVEAPSPSRENIPGRVIAFRQGVDAKGRAIPKRLSRPDVVVSEKPRDPSFCVLGIGGELVVEFPSGISNGPGTDVSVTEQSWGRDSLERAQVLVSGDGTQWVRLGLATNSTGTTTAPDTVTDFDLASVNASSVVRFVKVVDASVPKPKSLEDGFDISSVRASRLVEPLAQ